MESATSRLPDGEIGLCPHQGCGFTCCDFAAGNYIALYPGELAEAEALGRSTDHLEVWSDGNGGHRARCHARDCSKCDGGYKPLDCASYPYFPQIDDRGELRAGIKGSKCPLGIAETSAHRAWVVRRWQGLLRIRGDLAGWLRGVRLIGYQSVDGETPSTQRGEHRAPGASKPIA